MLVRFMKPGPRGRRRFIRRETDVIPAKGRTIQWGGDSFTVDSVEYDLNVTDGAGAAGQLAATVYLR